MVRTHSQHRKELMILRPIIADTITIPTKKGDATDRLELKMVPSPKYRIHIEIKDQYGIIIKPNVAAKKPTIPTAKVAVPTGTGISYSTYQSRQYHTRPGKKRFEFEVTSGWFVVLEVYPVKSSQSLC